jgi:hypothetical protein
MHSSNLDCISLAPERPVILASNEFYLSNRKDFEAHVETHKGGTLRRMS